MTHTDNRIIARWTLLVCALTLAFFTGWVAAPARDSSQKVEQACSAVAGPTISYMLGNLTACLHAGGIKTKI